MKATKAAGGRIHRVGYAPDPWAWGPWQYVDRSTGRWDDPQSTYRVLYAGTSPTACFVEVLAQFRPDDILRGEIAEIEADPRDSIYPSLGAGIIPHSWLDARQLGSANLSGYFVDIAHMETIATLRPSFLSRAVHYGLPDFDGSAIRVHEPRGLTREISRFLYQLDHERTPPDGIAYESRFGNGLQLWALFERGADDNLDRSRLLGRVDAVTIGPDDPDLATALTLHALELV
mgnify:FL=1